MTLDLVLEFYPHLPKCVSKYKVMINATTFDSPKILQGIDSGMRDPKFAIIALDRLNEQGADEDKESESVRQCLRICVQPSSP